MTTTVEISDDPRGTLPIWAWLAWMQQVEEIFHTSRLEVDYSLAEITSVSPSLLGINMTYTIRWGDGWESNHGSLFYRVAGVQGGLLKYVPKQKEGS